MAYVLFLHCQCNTDLIKITPISGCFESINKMTFFFLKTQPHLVGHNDKYDQS